MMKKALSFVAASTLFLFASCDYVEFPNEEVTAPPPPPEASQKVMLEEFTGQGCGNCPGGAVIAKQLKDAYGERLVLVSIHAGFFANIANPYGPNDMNCNEGEDIDASFGISAVGNPNGMVNRVESSGSVVISPTGWGTAIQNIFDNQEPALDIDLSASYDAGSNTITADVGVEVLQSLSSSYKIVAAVTENNVIAPQTNYSGTGDPNYASPEELNYPHQHLLRGHMNTSWGSDITFGGVGTTETATFSMAKGANWDSGELEVIVYVYDTATNEIVQVEAVHL